MMDGQRCGVGAYCGRSATRDGELAMWTSGFWQWVFLALVVGVPALICLTIVWMVFKAIRHGDWSAENFARIKSLLMGRRGVDEYRDSERD